MKHKNRIQKEKRRKELEEAKAIALQQSIRDSLDKQMEKMLAPPSNVERWLRAGEWRRDDSHHWEIKLKEGFEEKFDRTYSEAKDLVRLIKNENDLQRLEKRWRSIGGGSLQAIFPKNAIYDLVEDDHREARGRRLRRLVPEDKISVELDFELRNSNDAELENEDLHEIKKEIRSLPSSPKLQDLKPLKQMRKPP